MFDIIPTRQDLIKRQPKGIGAEIGVWRGYFSKEILACENVSKLFLIDSWQTFNDGPYVKDPLNIEDHEANYAETRRTLASELKTGRAEIVRGLSSQVVKEYIFPPLQWVYLDACHDMWQAWMDMKHWSTKLAPGGAILGHDYRSCPETLRRGYGVVEAVTLFCHMFNWKLTTVTQDDWPSYELRKI